MTRRLVAVAVLVTAWCALGVGVRATYGARTTADEPEYLLTALSLAEDRSLDVADERLARRYRPFHEPLLPVQTLRRADGSRVSPHDPLLPVLLALPMRLGGWVAAKLALAALAGVLAAATLWVAVRRFAVPPDVATLVVLAFALAPPLAVYGTQVYPELPAALAVVVAVGCLTGPLWQVVDPVDHSERQPMRGNPPASYVSRRIPMHAVAGAVGAVVALPWLAVKYVPVAAVLAVALGVRLWRRDRRVAAGVAAVLAAAGVAYLAAHQAWYGGWTAYASGDHFVGGELTAVGTRVSLAGRSLRLAGLLVDRSFGLVPWQPLFLAAPVAAGALLRRRPPGALLLAALLAAGWLGATYMALTMHGFWWPGRQVVVVLPVLVLAVATWAARSRAGRVAAWVGLGLGVTAYAWVVVEGWARRITWVVDFDTTTEPVVRLLRLALPDYRRLTAAGWALHAAWCVVLLGGLAFGARRADLRRA